MRDKVIANAAVVVIAVGLVAVGAFAIATPEAAAVMFGIPAHANEAHAYIRAAATRDIAIGCWFLTLLAIGVCRKTLGASLVTIALIPVGDFINVYLNGSQSTTALLLHGGSSAAFVVFGVWLWRTGVDR